MKAVKEGKEAPRGSYIPVMLNRHFLNGDAYIMAENAYSICAKDRCSYETFQADLAEQIKLGEVYREGRRLYLTKTWRYESVAAAFLANILQDNNAACPNFSGDLDRLGDSFLSEEQCNAVRMALSHRLSVILGGAGTGKSTLIKKIVEQRPQGNYVLAAPTGKAAKNLAEKTEKSARTVHSALGLRPNEDALSPVVWENTSLFVIDEASMLTLELLAGLLTKARKDCRIVLIGDPQQLLSVGSGNVLLDLLELAIPCTRLQQNFRQKDDAAALYNNVVGFPYLGNGIELRYDESFKMEEMYAWSAEKALIEEAVRRYQAGESVQVLSPYNSKTNLSVQALNKSLRNRLNPKAPEKKELKVDGMTFRDGDRVMITQNDYEHNCVNGDVGVLHVHDDDPDRPRYWVALEGARNPEWIGYGGLHFLTLAYAITVHKSQGSQYDTVLFPVVEGFTGMLYRNLVYTAISRAKRQVILYGSKAVLDTAIRKAASPRRSMLVAKTRMAMMKQAA